MEDKRNNKTYYNAFKKFCLDISIHGFAFLPGKRNQKAWIFLITITACYCCFQCKLNIDSYLLYDIKTKISLMDPENFTFPAITFCPQYMFKRSTVASFPLYNLGLAAFYGKTPEERYNLSKEGCLQQIVFYSLTTKSYL